MGKRGRAATLIASACLALAAGYYAYFLLRDAEYSPTSQSPTAGAEALFTTSLKDLHGNTQDFRQWRGGVLAVNFWATWCAPCRKEIPEFIRVQDKYRQQGLTFIGIAIDNKENVDQFVKEFGVNYPVLIDDTNAIELSRKLGNRYGVLPFTAFIGRDGILASSEFGGLDSVKLERIVGPLLATKP